LLGIAGEQETGAVAEGEGAGTSFDWKSNWYPVFPEIDADKAIPHSFQVFITSLQFSFGCQEILVLEFLRLRYSAWIKVPGRSQRPRKSVRRKEVNKQDI
jgi:hypothetical protein